MSRPGTEADRHRIHTGTEAPGHRRSEDQKLPGVTCLAGAPKPTGTEARPRPLTSLA